MNTMPAAVLCVLVQARGISQTNAGLMSVHGTLEKTEGAATRMGKQLAKGLKIAALGVAAGIAAAVKSAVDYDKEMRNVNSIAQLGERRFGKLREKVLALAGPTAQAPKTLAAGLYDLVSSGFNADEGLKVLAKSARAATAGLTTTEVATKAVAAVLNAYELPASKAGEVSDQLFETVNRGVLTFEELANSVGDVLPYSSQLGIGLNEVGAAVATMTKAGINAPETMTRLKAAMVTLLKPGSDLKKVLKGMGTTGEELLEKRGFLGALEAIAGQTDGTKEALAGLFPNVRALGAVLALTGIHTQAARADLQAFGDTVGATNRALSQQEKSTAFQLQRFKVQVEALAIGFGQKLLPEINKVIGVISDPKLTTQEKISKVFSIISTAAQKGLNAATQAALDYAPKIIGALASGMAREWTHLNPLAKILSVGAVIRLLGGKGSIGATGAMIGRLLGFGVGREMAAAATATITTEMDAAGVGSAALSGVGGASRWLGTDSAAEIQALRVQAVGQTERQALAAQGGIFAGVAGQQAASKFGSGFSSALKSIKWGRVGGLAIGAVLANEAIESFGHRSQERSGDIKEALKGIAGSTGIFDAGLGESLPDLQARAGKAKNLLAQFEQLEHHRVRISTVTQAQLQKEAAELDLTKQQRKQLEAMFSLMRQGSQLDVGVQLGMDPAKLEALDTGFRTLRSGVLTSMGDIGRVVQANADVIATQLPKGSKDAREKTVENFRAASKAIALAMQHEDISVKQGLARMRNLLHSAQLISGEDPLGIAKGFANSWKKAGQISDQKQQQMIRDLAKMPPKARQQAFNAMVQYGKGLVQGGQLPKQDLRDFVSATLSTFGNLQAKGKASATDLAIGVAGSFGSMGGAVATVLQLIQENTNHSLGAFGADPLKYAIKKVGDFLGLTPQNKQHGGFIVPGSGSGDRPGFMGEVGAYVLNREATKAYGFNRGGSVPLALEPGERYFTSHEVKAMGGAGPLEAMNRSVSRFQSGGEVGRPQLSGAAGPLLDLGQGAVNRVADAAKEYLAAHKPKDAAGYSGPAFGPTGTSMYKGILMATWVHQALEYAVSQGVNAQPTSGYRSHAENVAHGRNYFSEHEKTQYPGGAIDFGGYVDPAAKAVKDAVVAATRSFRYPLLAPIGFRDDGHASGTGHQLGGLIQALASGGSVVEAVGAILGSNGLDLLSSAGVLGNAWRESRWNTASVGTGGGGLWGFTTSPISLEDLKAYAASQGVDWTDARAQTQFMLHHLPNSLRGAMNAMGSVEDTTTYFMNKWERPGVPALNERIEGAHKALKILGGEGGELTEGQKKLAEGKQRKANNEHHLQALMGEVNEAHSIPAKQSKLWRLIKFWGRVGIFDKDEHAHIVDAVQNAAAQSTPQAAVGILQNLASYAKGHGEITGQDPSNFRSMEKAIQRAQDRGVKERKKAVERQKKHVESVHNRVKSRIEKRAAFPELVSQLSNLRHGADAQEEFASQLVSLEPENLSDGYVDQERGAYQGELGHLLSWRNSVVCGQELATAEIGRFQKQLADIEAMAPQAEVKGSGKGAGLASAQALGRSAYSKVAYKIPILKEAIANATTMRDETWAGELEELQGLSGPKGILDVLGPDPVAGAIGGRIFETQNSIRELALKVGAASDAGDSERTGLLEQLLREANQRTAVSEAQRVELEGWDQMRKGFAGFHALGGKIPAGMWGIAGEQGPEPVVGPATVMSNREGREVFGGGGSPNVTVNVYEGSGKVEVEVDDELVEAIVTHRKFAPGAQKAARAGRGTGRMTPGGR